MELKLRYLEFPLLFPARNLTRVQHNLSAQARGQIKFILGSEFNKTNHMLMRIIQFTLVPRDDDKTSVRKG